MIWPKSLRSIGKSKIDSLFTTIPKGWEVTLPCHQLGCSLQAGPLLAEAISLPTLFYFLNFQPLSRIELSANYRIYDGKPDPIMGEMGFGDEAERVGNLKLGIKIPSDGFKKIPSLVVGFSDFIGTQRFNSQYLATTYEFLRANLEVTIGWGKGRMDGWFGGVAWSPFRFGNPFIRGLTFMGEYDANDYEHHPHEHPDGASSKSKVNLGFTYNLYDRIAITAHTLRGEKIGVFGALTYPLGIQKEMVTKTHQSLLYTAPLDFEPLGILRTEYRYALELARTLRDQGFTLDQVLIEPYLDEHGVQKKILYVQVINSRYLFLREVRQRLLEIFARTLPDNIDTVRVNIVAEGLQAVSWTYSKTILLEYLDGTISPPEMEALTPLSEPEKLPDEYIAKVLYHRKKPLTLFYITPRIQTFFGNSEGKFKYAFSAVAGIEGFLPSEVFYQFQTAYNISASNQKLREVDLINPSQLPNVRTDTVKYFQSNSVTVEKAFLQRAFHMKKSLFTRVAVGYFEPAYAGFAVEALIYPINSLMTVGIEGAIVWKRSYEGMRLEHKIRKYDGVFATMIPFLGKQLFLDFSYNFTPLQLEFSWKAGRFLAGDWGIRNEVARTFDNGVRFGLWYTFTNGHDKVNGSTYYDKGFFFEIPFELFLRRNSRSVAEYSMSAWLRDVGAFAQTGKTLTEIIRAERR